MVQTKDYRRGEHFFDKHPRAVGNTLSNDGSSTNHCFGRTHRMLTATTHEQLPPTRRQGRSRLRQQLRDQHRNPHKTVKPPLLLTVKGG